MGLVLAGTAVITYGGWDIDTAFSACVASIGNVGPGFAFAGPMFTYAAFSGWTKLLLSFLMLCGRLELFSIIVLFSGSYWDPDR